jgi:hypothetical protein
MERSAGCQNGERPLHGPTQASFFGHTRSGFLAREAMRMKGGATRTSRRQNY